jgi:hypothetical protein
MNEFRAMREMKQPSIISEWLPPIIIWVGSLYSVPQSAFILGMVVAYILRRDNKFIWSFDFLAVALIVFLSTVNFFYGMLALPDGMDDRQPYFLAYIFTFIFATQLRRRDMQIIAYLIAFECIFVFIEVALGENTIFTSSPLYRSDLSFVMLYFARPFGLSDGINTMGGKILIAIVLADYFLEKSTLKNAIRIILFAALIIVFSRTAIFAAAIHYFIYFVFYSDIKNKGRKTFAFGTFLLICNWTLFSIPWDALAEQLNRGKENGVDLSYRDVIWEQCLQFIEAHPLFGNGSSRFHVWLSDYGTWEHAHNSFFHLYATNGILIATFTLLWLASRVSISKIKFIFPIVIFSMGQYGIFWGISFIDIVFLYLVLNREPSFSLNRKRNSRLSSKATSFLIERA